MKLPRSTLLSLSLSLSLLVAQAALAVTWSISPRPDAPDGTAASALVPQEFQGQRFCNSVSCVVVAETPSDVALISSLTSDPRVHLEPLPDAHKIYFAKSTFDIETGTFEKPFPGSTDVSPSSPVGLFVVVFKSYPRQAWLEELARAGLSVLEPLPPMGYQVYGSRATLATVAAKTSYIYRFADIPAGVGRFGVNEKIAADADTPLSTTVVAVGSMASLVKERLMALTGTAPSEVYSTGTHLAFESVLTNEHALALSRLPEVVAVHRNDFHTAVSDERFNRVVSGTWLSPLPSAWPAGTSLGQNSGPPYHWDGFLSSLQGIGINTSRETIGFLDSGVDDALYRDANPPGWCPPHLGLPPPGTCNLVFVTDVTSDFNALITRGDDLLEHGSITTAIAAGLSSGTRPRDGQGWSFTQGIAPGAKVAMSKHFINCLGGSTIREDSWTNPLVDTIGLNYSLAELGTTGTLPDFHDGTHGPGVRLFNHSWNDYYHSGGGNPSDYGLNSALLDQATRLLSKAKVTLEPTHIEVKGDSAPSLHVVSAGNYPGPFGDVDPNNTDISWGRAVVSPANAKNVIAVGATSSLNDEGFTPGSPHPGSPCGFNNPDHGTNSHRIEDFSRFGYPNMRLKPDLVAPGTRAYGPRSRRLLLDGGHPSCSWQGDQYSVNFSGCNFNLWGDQAQEYAWWVGTSFAAPVVSGVAALVHDWFRVLTNNTGTNASPALVKAALIASATNLRTSVNPMRIVKKQVWVTGLDDITPDTPNPTLPLNVGDKFEVTIDGTGTPNTFMWRKNSGPLTQYVPITGAAQLLSDSFHVTFGSTTGHTNASSWSFMYDCSEIKPAPDKYQGWGGVSLDRLFRPASNYYWFDQGKVLYDDGEGVMSWSKTLTITDRLKPVAVALVWTDRESPTTLAADLNLVNDLDLTVSLLPGAGQFLVGNSYYPPYTPCDAGRNGYSLYRPTSWMYDRKNNVERVDVSPDAIAQANDGNYATYLTVTVNMAVLRGNGLGCVPHPPVNCPYAQDFALFVVNAHE